MPIGSVGVDDGGKPECYWNAREQVRRIAASEVGARPTSLTIETKRMGRRKGELAEARGSKTAAILVSAFQSLSAVSLSADINENVPWLFRSLGNH